MKKLAQMLSILNLLVDEPPPVLIRTYSAGVHFGILESRNGKEAVLRNARRVWSWKGGNTLNELVANGPAKGSRISGQIAKIVLTEAIEVIYMTADQYAALSAGVWE